MNYRKLRAVAEGGLRLLFPPVCPCCGEILDFSDHENGFCADCRKEIVYIMEPACKTCGKPLSAGTAEYCRDCAAAQHLFTQSKAAYVYSGGIKTAMYGFKYGNCRSYACIFAKDLVRLHGRWLAQSGIDLILPVPMHGRKKRLRGYNQAGLLAKELSGQTGIPFSDRILIRARATRPQKELNDSERRKNLKNAFKIAQSSVKSKRVLIVDDIYTTGATLDECAKVLICGGAEAVFGMTVVVGEGL